MFFPTLKLSEEHLELRLTVSSPIGDIKPMNDSAIRVCPQFLLSSYQCRANLKSPTKTILSTSNLTPSSIFHAMQEEDKKNRVALPSGSKEANHQFREECL
jgi:hypothetical protein